MAVTTTQTASGLLGASTPKRRKPMIKNKKKPKGGRRGGQRK